MQAAALGIQWVQQRRRRRRQLLQDMTLLFCFGRWLFLYCVLALHKVA